MTKTPCAEHEAPLVNPDLCKVTDKDILSAYLEDNRKVPRNTGVDNKKNSRVIEEIYEGDADVAPVDRDAAAEYIHYIKVN